jgi:hypothetical protein
MVKIEFDADPSKFFRNSVSKFKTNRYLQIAAVVVFLLLVSQPAYSLYLDITTPANAHERDNFYIVLEEDWGSVPWIESTQVTLSDEESFSVIMDETQFPSEADGMNIVMVIFEFYVMDTVGDNEETSGIGCAWNDGEDAYDSVAASAEHPSASSSNTVTEYGDYLRLEMFEYPEFDTFPLITGYTVEEIDEMFDASDDVKGEYSFNLTGFVEAGESTTECERSDSSVTVEYEILLYYSEFSVMEWNDEISLFG